jgi:hypothetical protein
MHRNLQAAADEEKLLIDDASITVQHATLSTLFQRNGIVEKWCVSDIAGSSLVDREERGFRRL